MINREEAWNIVCEFIQSEGLRKHALAVETCVAAYARKFGEDEHKWGITALLHDFDWEIHPQAPDHPMKGEAMLAERGVDDDIRRAILSHANYSGVPRDSPLEKTLYACDELAGFITAIPMSNPPQRLRSRRPIGEKEDEGQSLRPFREPPGHYRRGAGTRCPARRAFEFCIKAMQERAEELGLKGSLKRERKSRFD